MPSSHAAIHKRRRCLGVLLAACVATLARAEAEEEEPLEVIDYDKVTPEEARAEAARAERSRTLKARRDNQTKNVLAAILFDADDSMLLTMTNATSCAMKDGADMLPLHHALAKRRSDAVILRMLEVYPDALRAKSVHGELPLHIAVEFGASEAVIEQMIRLYREALFEKDDDPWWS